MARMCESIQLNVYVCVCLCEYVWMWVLNLIAICHFVRSRMTHSKPTPVRAWRTTSRESDRQNAHIDLCTPIFRRCLSTLYSYSYMCTFVYDLPLRLSAMLCGCVWPVQRGLRKCEYPPNDEVCGAHFYDYWTVLWLITFNSIFTSLHDFSKKK